MSDDFNHFFHVISWYFFNIRLSIYQVPLKIKQMKRYITNFLLRMSQIIILMFMLFLSLQETKEMHQISNVYESWTLVIFLISHQTSQNILKTRESNTKDCQPLIVDVKISGNTLMKPFNLLVSFVN